MNALVSNIKAHWLFYGILLLGIVFRFVPLNQYQFSHDELSALSRAHFTTFSDLIYKGVLTDTHPMLIQWLLWLYLQVLPTTEVWVKVPFLLCGIASIICVYIFSLKFFNKNVGIVSSIIISYSFIFIIYSSYARMYITGVLFSICLLYAAFNLIFNNTHQLKNYFLYILFVTLCAYNHHISALFAVVVSVLTFFYINKSQRLTFTTVCMCAIALYLPILSLTLTQLKLSSLSWLPKINPLEVLYFMRAFFGTGLVGIILMLLFGFSILISIFKLKTITQKQQFLFLCFSINYLIIHIYSVIVGSILQNSNLLFSGIALLVFVATFFKNSTSKKMGYISFLLTLLLSCQSIFKKQLFFKVHHHEYEMQVNATKQTIDDFKTTDVSVIYKGEPFFISYYLSKYKLPHQKYFNTQTCSAKQLIDYLKNQTSQYIIVGDVSPAQIKMIKQFYPYALNNIESFFYNVYVFTKFYNTEPIPKEFAFNYSTYDFKIYTDTVKPLQLYNDSIVYCVTAHAKEFPFHISLNMDKKPIYKEQYLVIDFCIRNDSLLSSKDVICAEIKNKQGQSLYYKSEKMIDQITLNHKQNHIFMDVFIGSDHKQWIHKNASINFYLQKSKRSSFEIVNVKLYSLDDHPNKWLVWR